MAIIYASTKGFLDPVPVNKAKEFQTAFVEAMRGTGKEALADFKSGKLTDEAVAKTEEIAKDIASRFSN